MLWRISKLITIKINEALGHEKGFYSRHPLGEGCLPWFPPVHRWWWGPRRTNWHWPPIFGVWGTRDFGSWHRNGRCAAPALPQSQSPLQTPPRLRPLPRLLRLLVQAQRIPCVSWVLPGCSSHSTPSPREEKTANTKRTKIRYFRKNNENISWERKLLMAYSSIWNKFR